MTPRERCRRAQRFGQVIDRAGEFLRQNHDRHHVGNQQYRMRQDLWLPRYRGVVARFAVHGKIAAVPAGLHEQERGVQADRDHNQKRLLQHG